LAETGLLGIEVTEGRASVSRIARDDRGIVRPGGGRPEVVSLPVEKNSSADGSRPASLRTLCIVSYRASSVVVGCRSL